MYAYIYTSNAANSVRAMARQGPEPLGWLVPVSTPIVFYKINKAE